jgi:hypothetical protein
MPIVLTYGRVFVPPPHVGSTVNANGSETICGGSFASAEYTRISTSTERGPAGSWPRSNSRRHG